MMGSLDFRRMERKLPVYRKFSLKAKYCWSISEFLKYLVWEIKCMIMNDYGT